MTTQRLIRCGDSAQLKDLFQSGKLTNAQPFFEGDNVRKRMDLVRQSILYIRQQWDQYDVFMNDLRSLIEANRSTNDPQDELTDRLAKLYSSRINWYDRLALSQAFVSDYEAVRLYTSAEGYERIYHFINRVFRNEASDELQRIVTSAVFFVELLNIDLYNYSHQANTKAQNFEGVIYRGMVLSDHDLRRFSEICKQPLSERYISIPLGLHSTSLARSQAESFIQMQLSKSPSLNALIWKIHVASLSETILQAYRALFPTSVVSSICAVPIYELSEFSYEAEVLLRGPFFQVLNFYTEGNIAQHRLHVLELVMLTGNRDHPTTAELGIHDHAARTFFATITGIERNQFSLDYCMNHHLSEDAEGYKRMIEKGKTEFDRLQKL